MSLPVYRALLRLYPASYRVEYEAELLRTFAESTRGRGGFAATLAAIGDVVPNALAAHWQQTARTWSAGDFTGDGKIDAFDLNALAANWQATDWMSLRGSVEHGRSTFDAGSGHGVGARQPRARVAVQ